MKPILRRTVSLVLALLVTVSCLPASAIAYAAGQEDYTLENGYVKVTVSPLNGGFVIWNQEGDRLNKDDNNQNLLYHNGEFDTSFTSFQVAERVNGIDVVKEYLFGGNYNYEGSGTSSSPLAVSKDATGISAVWTVDGITFTQRIELSNLGSAEHGMVRISYSVRSPRQISVKARVLLDSALGTKDYAYYEVVDSLNQSRRIEQETVLTDADYIPANFFGYDDPEDPSIVAYTVNSGDRPYQVAFGHWNNLASTLFDFAPDATLTFTNATNRTYRTADSAYALYYDLGEVPTGQEKSVSTYYGMYSNQHVSNADAIGINATAPTTLTLAADKRTYLPEPGVVGSATFSVLTTFTNIEKSGAQDYARVAVAVYTSNGITPLDSGGGELVWVPDYQNPYSVEYLNFRAGDQQTTTFYFRAAVGSEASYRKIEFRVFNMPDSAGGQILKENQIGQYSVYVLCPGGDGELPKVTFTSCEPKVLYNQGNRRLKLTGTDFSLLANTSQYSVTLTGPTSAETGAPVVYTVPSSQLFFPDEGMLEVLLNETMVPGDYKVSLEWGADRPEGIPQSLSAPALRVTMSEDKAYRNDVYGVIAIVQLAGGDGNSYEIRSYASEEAWRANEGHGHYTEALLVFRGEFIQSERDALGRPVYKATSLKAADNNGNTVINNPISLNNCIDFDNGTVSIYYEGPTESKKICVDFSGDLWTSTTRSSIWSGNAALTEIKDGADYGLVPYNRRGVKLDTNEKPITLIWPCGLGIAQTIAGMIFNLTYGALGIMYDTTEDSLPPNPIDYPPVLGRVLSFSAKLDLSFLVPNKEKSEEEKAWDRMQERFNMVDDNGTKLRDKWNGLDFTRNQIGDPPEDGRDTKGQASVMVDNILYGCGRGYIGFNCSVNVALPAYIDAMPSIKANLKINTIGDWSFAVDGSCKFTTIELEVSIDIRSYKGAPIPNKLYFFITGFEPGINVDGFGVLWITGGGGGFDNLYDTIFASTGIPPLKILLSVTFDIIKVLSARADLSLSLRGIGFTVSDVKIKFTNIVALERAALQFDWYPGFYFMASVRASLLDVLKGSGYIVVINNEYYHGFVEFFIRAKASVPKEVPLIGGIEFGQIDLGVNNEKIWGAVSAFVIKVGITYHWGGEFDFGFKTEASPTFPELLGYEDVPVYYDAELDRTLYMRVGTNFSLAAMAEVVDSLDEAPILLAAGDPVVKSNADKTRHQLNLGEYRGQAGVFLLRFPAPTIEDARQIAGSITIGSAEQSGTPGYRQYALRLYDGTNLDTANANITFDEVSQLATLAVTVVDPGDFDMMWHIGTPEAPTDVILYSVAPTPEITSLSGSLAGNNVTVNWDGSKLDELDSASFYLTTDSTGSATDGGFHLGTLTQATPARVTDKTATFPVPQGLPTGDYYIRAVYTKEGIVNGSVTGTHAEVGYVNTWQPADPQSVTITNAGDLMFGVDVQYPGDPAGFDGYVLNVYELDQASGEYVASKFANLVREKRPDGQGNMVLPPMTVGGRVSGFDDNGQPAEYALLPGASYKVGVRAYKNVYGVDGTTVLYTVPSNEVLSNSSVMRAPTPPVLEVQSLTPSTTLTRMEPGLDLEGNAGFTAVQHETYSTRDIDFIVTSDVPVTGDWTLDSEVATSDFGIPAATTSVSISLSGLSDGDHTLTLRGTDTDGDSFRFTHPFTVDTQPPKLLLTSPTNGGSFSRQGVLQVAGQSDPGARFTVVVDGATVRERKTVAELGGAMDSDGVFSFTCPVDSGVSSHEVLIIATDEMGNFTRAIVQVVNAGLADVRSIDIYMDGQRYSNLNLPTGLSRQSQLSLVATAGPPGSSSQFTITDNSLVGWQAEAVRGSAHVDAGGRLTVGAGSLGHVVGSFMVAEGASMTAAATFGAEAFSSHSNDLVMAQTIGGTASISGNTTGIGRHEAGAQVEIVAVPNSGYRFAGWTSAGANGNGVFADPSSATTVFTMPNGDVTVTAHFEAIAGPTGDSEDGYEDDALPTIWASGDQIVSIILPAGVDENTFVPFYLVEGRRVIVPLSRVENGRLVFRAPVSGAYGFMQYAGSFNDTEGHWASDYIAFAAARGLFGGVGDDMFDPNGSMTRAMFVTVLSRLEGISAAPPDGGGGDAAGGTSSSSSFPDVPSDTWYSEAVAWAAQNGIVGGHDDGTFGPDQPITREQMCAILLRYLTYKGYSLDLIAEKASFGDEGSIGSWAVDAVSLCQQFGLILGKPGNVFDPAANSTRAEACTVFFRLIDAILSSLS